MSEHQSVSSYNGIASGLERYQYLTAISHYLSGALIVVGVALFFYGAAWNYATHRYLEGFSDAIIPLDGTAEQKSEALLGWLRHTPDRLHGLADHASPRDPVGVVQDARLLQVCGSASNAFINLADAAGLKTRRLLLLGPSGGAKHVVVEVLWGNRWVVVDPSYRAVFRDASGRPLGKEELRNSLVFQDATSRIPDYNPEYSFEHTVHLHLQRIPGVGPFLRPALTLLFPRWEDSIDWGYLPEHPSLWPIVISFVVLIFGFLLRAFVCHHTFESTEAKTFGFRKLLRATGKVLLHRSA
ncbi:MAG: hypothetical protein ABSF15_20115 [Candidatus Sulfotelmatobacter sp.]|jgi:hypothetical protein